MILQSLVSYYEAMSSKGILSKYGWTRVKVSYALEIDESGNLLGILPLKKQDKIGKKEIPRLMEMPAPVKRSVGIKANYLCDNASYILGIDAKNNPERTKQCFEASRTLHRKMLNQSKGAFAKAIINFFDCWDISKIKECDFLASCLEDIMTSNITFFLKNEFANENKELCAIWDSFYRKEDDNPTMRCLVTGREDVIVPIHPAIKGVRNAQSSGAALSSFNADAYCSYEKKQNFNAPVGQYAAFAYTTALNYLLSDYEHVCTVGDTTVVYWAESGESQCQDAFAAMITGCDDEVTSKDLHDLISHVARGEPVKWNDNIINPNNNFFVLGISPNAARLSVRFFLQNTFGDFAKNIMKHYERLEIAKDHRCKWELIPLWVILKQTINENSKDKAASPQMAGDTLKSILTGRRYPTTLYQKTQLRIKADRNITQERAAIIKAYLMKNTDKKTFKEVLCVKLNEETEYQPYVLGRLFSILEAIQEKANPGINATIKDKYFTSACATPAIIFPTLINLTDKHLRKMEKGSKIFYSKQLQEILAKVTEEYPSHYNLNDQGIFQLGYYHQTQKRYEKN